MSTNEHQILPRTIGTGGAILLGLGAILGTGVFVSIGLAAGAAGASLLLAIALAGLLALFNALSSAQLAAAHPVSGGTYEYGYQYLTPALGFTAGWLFLCAKSASAATAALGFAGYIHLLAGVNASTAVTPIALLGVLGITLITAQGLHRSSQVNAVIVAVTLIALAAFVTAGLPVLISVPTDRWANISADVPGVLGGAALMFVAFTGYGRLATLGEEVHDPARTIPRAILWTLALTVLLYWAVAAVGLAAVGPEAFYSAATGEAAPLATIARALDQPQVAFVIAAGAITAMLGVLLNLVLGLSRVLLAMGRRGDMPAAFAQIDRAGRTPQIATWATGGLIAALTLLGDIQLTWSLAAVTVLGYYAITNLAALGLPSEHRRYPRIFAWAGLLGCLSLLFFVDLISATLGAVLLSMGLMWHYIARRRR